MTTRDSPLAPLAWDPLEIEVAESLTEVQFLEQVVTRSRPLVLRGLVADWRSVKAARRSVGDFVAYIKSIDTGQPTEVMEAPAAVRGRLFYTEDLHRFNFVKRQRSVSDTLDQILAQGAALEPMTIYAGSIPIARHLPAFPAANPAPFALPDLAPRIWIGGPARVQTHFDPVHNLACAVAGRRRFIVFPPDQLANLYLGPFELTPAGAVISLASLEEPDFERFPRLRAALDTAMVAVLEPGDALFLPHYWFHHVTALGAFNAQVNYWWGEQKRGLDNPRNSFLTALLGIKDLVGDEKLFWKTMFEHYVFHNNGDPMAYIPADLQSALGVMTPEMRERIRRFTLSLLNE